MMLADLIDTHAATLKEWLASAGPGEDLETDCESYLVFERAEHSFVVYQCLSDEEVQRKLAYVAGCPTLRDAVHVDLCPEFLASLRLTSVTAMTPGLADAVTAWRQAADRYSSHVASDPAKDHDELWHEKDEAETAMLKEPCLGLIDIREKVKIALSDQSVFDSLASSTYSEDPPERTLRIFLRSLLGDNAPVSDTGH